jgi:hypothetical protein
MFCWTYAYGSFKTFAVDAIQRMEVVIHLPVPTPSYCGHTRKCSEGLEAIKQVLSYEAIIGQFKPLKMSLLIRTKN